MKKKYYSLKNEVGYRVSGMMTEAQLKKYTASGKWRVASIDNEINKGLKRCKK